ncbi:MAG: hypothetical protein E7478_07160 [Ruminococcaceae bacterium]|nr:hypothetical protein [Oscillospiraceae bacterium]
MDKNSAAVYGGTFDSIEAAQDYMKLVDGKPKRFMDEMYLKGDFSGRIEIRFFDKKTNKAEVLLNELPYSDRLISFLQEAFMNKLKRTVNTVIVIYDFYLGAEHMTGHTYKQMSEKKTDDHYIFHVANIFPYDMEEYKRSEAADAE